MPQLKHRVADLIDERYEVRKILGSGGFGTVYGCRDAELDISVAVKELHVLDEPQSGQNERETALRQFRAEATHLSRLRHPHIVSGHYEPQNGRWNVCPICGLDFPNHSHCPEHGGRLIPLESRHYLVMEYIAGPDLLQLATSQNGARLSVKQLLFLAPQIAGALAHIHARNLVHRDIKPENIRIRRAPNQNDEAVLLDFGIATHGEETGEKYGTRAQRHTTGGGTVGYAPENPSEAKNPDARSDVHAFGMTLYHLATGLDPTDPLQNRKIRSYTPRDFVPEIPEALEDLILECVAFEPKNRPQNGAQLLERLENLGAERQNAPQNSVSTSAPAPASAPQNASPSVPAPAPSAPPAPTLLFRTGHYVSDLAELRYMFSQHPRDCQAPLLSGDLERFLENLGEENLARDAAQIRARYRSHPEQGVEILAQKIGLDAPQLEVSPHEISFGTLKPKAKKTLELKVRNRGRGHLFGLVRASHSAIKTSGSFEGNKTKIAVTFDANRLDAGEYTGQIELDSSAGQFAIPFRARVAGESFWALFWSTVASGVAGAAVGGFLRSAPFYQTEIATQWGNFRPDTFSYWQNMLFAGALWLVLLGWTFAESFLRRSCAIWAIFASVGSIATIYALVSAPQILSSFDEILGFGGPNPVANWIFGGALAGTIYGAIRRPKELFSARIIGAILGFFVVLALLYLAFEGAATR